MKFCCHSYLFVMILVVMFQECSVALHVLMDVCLVVSRLDGWKALIFELLGFLFSNC